MRILQTVISFIFIITGASRQENVQKEWDVNSPLQWRDFQAPARAPNKDLRVRASTFTGELYKYRRIGKDSADYKFKFTARSVMIRSKSWADPAYKTPELLQYE